MRSAWIALVAGLVGAGLGWVLAGVVHEETTPGSRPEVEPVAAADAPRAEPRLVGPPRPVAVSPRTVSPPVAPSGPTPEDREALEVLETDGVDDLVLLEGELTPVPGEHRGWQALLTLYALAGRDADFQRVVGRALDAGLEPASVLELLQLLPAERQIGVVDHLLASRPDLSWDVGVVADIYTEAGAGERAVDLLVPALEAGATADLAARLVRADPDRAARLLGALSHAEEWDADLLRQVGRSLLEASRPELALAFLQDALARAPLDFSALSSLGEVDPTLALEHARALTLQHADRSDVWACLGRMEQQAGNKEAAFAAWREAAGLDMTTEVLYGLMEADPDRAYETASELVAHTTDDEVLGALAKIALKSGRVEDTMATLLEAHERDPSDHEWMTAMVALDPKRAADVIGRSASTYAGESRDEVLGAHGNALLALGNSDAAFERYREAFELDPADWEWQRGLARADPARAIPLLEARREESEDEGDLLGALADAYAGAGRRAQALATYEEAVAAGGGDEWYARMGRVDPARALEALERRTREAPDASEAWGALGDLQRDLGHRAEARAAYGRARELAPTNLVYEIRYRQMAD